MFAFPLVGETGAAHAREETDLSKSMEYVQRRKEVQISIGMQHEFSGAVARWGHLERDLHNAAPFRYVARSQKLAMQTNRPQFGKQPCVLQSSSSPSCGTQQVSLAVPGLFLSFVSTACG
jgi:hypothetical protein